MFGYIWPIGLVVISNIVYQICAKSTPKAIDPFASLTVTYTVSAVACAILYFVIGKGGNIFKEYTKLNWAPFTLGLVIIGLEAGFIFVYKAGWQVSTASIVQSSFLAVALIFVGFLLYKEDLSLNKIIGVVICLIGLYFINKK